MSRNFLLLPGFSSSFLVCWILAGRGRFSPRDGAGLLEKYECLRAAVESILFIGYKVTSLVRRSRRSSPAAVKMSARGVPFWCLNWMKSGKLVNPGQVSSEGVPRAWKVLLSWSNYCRFYACSPMKSLSFTFAFIHGLALWYFRIWKCKTKKLYFKSSCEASMIKLSIVFHILFPRWDEEG